MNNVLSSLFMKKGVDRLVSTTVALHNTQAPHYSYKVTCFPFFFKRHLLTFPRNLLSLKDKLLWIFLLFYRYCFTDPFWFKV